MKKMRVLSMMLALLLLTGCAGPAVPSQTGDIPKEAESAVQTAAPELEDDDVLLVDKAGDYPDYRLLIDGSVNFEEDSSRQASVVFPADGSEKSITLEDGNGLAWELVIPADALAEPQTITITAMKNIKSSLGKISGGVVLQPDGLNFIAPVKLSVKGEAVGTSGLIFSGNSKGEELELPIAQEGQGSIGSMLYHFSTAYATSDQQIIENLARESAGSVRKLSALAKQILSKPIEVPVPPAIPIKCHHDTEDQDDIKIDKYLKDFYKPEGDLIGALIAAKRGIAFTTDTSPGYDIELELNKRLVKKASKLFRQYKGQEDMYIAVAVTVLKVEREAALLGQPLEGDYSFMPFLAEWAYSIAEKYLNDLVRNHQYKNIHPIMKLSYHAALLGTPKANKLMEELEEAMTFELETRNTVKIGVAPSIMTYVVESKAKLIGMIVSETGVVWGNGLGTYKSFETPPLEGTEIKLELDQLGKSFNVLVGMDGFVPCKSDTFKILIDRFGAENETLTAILPDVPPNSRSRPVVQQASEKGFADKNQGGIYEFTVTLRDGQKVAVEQTFPAADMGMDIEFLVKLTHMP